MKKLLNLWEAKKALCIGVIAGVVVIIAGGVTTAIILNTHTEKKEAASNEKTTRHSKDTDKKDNKTTQTSTNESTEAAKNATDESTEESKEESSEAEEEKNTEVKEVAVDNGAAENNNSWNNEGNEAPADNNTSGGTDNSGSAGNTSSNGNQTSGGGNNNETPAPTPEPAPAVVHGKDGVILDELWIYRDVRTDKMPATREELKNLLEAGKNHPIDDIGLPLATKNCSITRSGFNDGIIFDSSTKEDVKRRYGNPYEENKYYYYKYGNDGIFIRYYFEDNGVLREIQIGTYNALNDEA